MKHYATVLMLWVSVSGVFAESVLSWAGVETRVLAAEEREGLPVPAGAGLRVVALPEAGPVAAALAAGDVLVEFAGQLLVHPQQLGVLLELNQDAGEVAVSGVRGDAALALRLPMRWEKPEPVIALPEIAVPEIPRDRALPAGGTDAEARERALLEAIRKQADEKLAFDGILTGSAVRRDGAEAADE
jgi:hypothetical protein